MTTLIPLNAECFLDGKSSSVDHRSNANDVARGGHVVRYAGDRCCNVSDRFLEIKTAIAKSVGHGSILDPAKQIQDVSA